MTWRPRGGVLVWDGPTATLNQAAAADESAYRWCSVPVDQRPRPASCGRPGNGRRQHNVHGEPTCGLCTAAERAYAQWRRDVGRL